jgi:hypothetical protein
MQLVLSILVFCQLAACAAVPLAADPTSDAPEFRTLVIAEHELPSSYAEALSSWHTAEEVNAWIGARFQYDADRSAKLSENQRAQVGRIQIHEPGRFFATPTGVCVDLARFAVETLREIAPGSRPTYLMIEFDPVVISGNTLRRHWLVMFERDGKLYFFADSKRPGYVAGPYTKVQPFIDQYAQYRGRRIVSHRTLDSYERKLKRQAPGAAHAVGAPLGATRVPRTSHLQVRSRTEAGGPNE